MLVHVPQDMTQENTPDHGTRYQIPPVVIEHERHTSLANALKERNVFISPHAGWPLGGRYDSLETKLELNL